MMNSCNAGYGGYDCSQRTCPYGRDPTLDGSAATDDEEEFVIECQADAGYFTITVLGMNLVSVIAMSALLFYFYQF